jgi:hypothetical protein
MFGGIWTRWTNFKAVAQCNVVSRSRDSHVAVDDMDGIGEALGLARHV